jgi:hypothetical protein
MLSHAFVLGKRLRSKVIDFCRNIYRWLAVYELVELPYPGDLYP